MLQLVRAHDMEPPMITELGNKGICGKNHGTAKERTNVIKLPASRFAISANDRQRSRDPASDDNRPERDKMVPVVIERQYFGISRLQIDAFVQFIRASLCLNVLMSIFEYFLTASAKLGGLLGGRNQTYCCTIPQLSKCQRFKTVGSIFPTEQ